MRFLLLACALAHSPQAASLGNVSGTFRGTWAARGGEPGHALKRWTPALNGTAFLTLATTPTRVDGVFDVTGELVLTTSETRLTPDIRMGVEGGVHVVETNELRLTLASKLLAEVSAEETAAGGAPYRAAVADVARERTDAARQHTGRLFSGFNSSAKGSEPTGLRRRCPFRLNGAVSAHPSPRDWHGLPATRLAAELLSAECGLALGFDVQLIQQEMLVEKAKTAAMLAAAMALAMTSLTARLIEGAASPAALSRISFACLCHQSLLDSCACLLHLTAGLMADQLFASYAGTALCFFALFSLLEMRLLAAIWRARQPNALSADWRGTTRALHTRFYASMLAAVLLVWLLRAWTVTLVLSLHSFWVWQIVHTTVSDASRPLTLRYVLGMSCARLPMPLYFLACPRNWARVDTQPVAAAALMAWMAVQAGLLTAQHLFGARCFIPERWRPPKFYYDRAATPQERAAAGWEDAEDSAEGLECVVCQMPLAREQPGERPSGRMVTPCAHFFHRSCLESWLAIKLECPTCRGLLPLP